MRKIFLAMFGGTPARGELCLYLNAAAGFYQDCEGIQCYPIDKDVRSPNYVNTRNLYNQYKAFREVVKESGMASVHVERAEDMYESMLEKAGIRSENETLRNLMAREYGLSEQDSRLLNICFTQEQQVKNMKGGYYGKANIGSVTGDILIHKEIYENLKLVKDIKNALRKGYGLDVVIICSSFGGTGASLGINFGEYLKGRFKEEKNLHIHCIYIQPYFSFPNPKENDKWKLDCKDFYAKSATVITILGQKKDFIKENEQEADAVFDRFYYLGQEVLDQISNRNSAVGEQDNSIHIIDLLVSLAVQDILLREENKGYQLYGYQYSTEGTEQLTWTHMPFDGEFKQKHVHMMRFCEFMLDCMEPLFADNYSDYETEILFLHLYGYTGIINKTAKITENIKTRFHEDMKKCFEFCRSYIEYWIEMERNTKFGNSQTNVTCFFNLNELERVLRSKQDKYIEVRESAHSLNLTKTDAYNNFEKGYSCLQIYDSLCHERRLKCIASPGRDEASVAKTLVKAIFKKCAIEN